MRQVHDFTRKLHWAHALPMTSDRPRFGLLPSTRWPPESLVPPQIRRLSSRILNGCRTMLGTLECDSFPCNLSTGDRSELARLQNVSSVVTTADKGGKWTIISRHLYDQEAMSQLSNPTYYTNTQTDISRFVQSRITQLLNHLRRTGFITKREHLFLLPPTESKPRTFRLLPKLHKTTWPSAGMPNGRPIISDRGSSTRNASNLVEFFLQPLCQLLPSHLKDSGHLIALLRQANITSSSILFTFDIASLYTNVPIEEGLECVSRAFLRHPDPSRPDATILSILRLILTSNAFSFRNSNYVQIHGVAMGKTFGGSFANIFLGEWEHRALSSHPLRPSLWARFQDDIFGIWNHGTDALLDFHRHLNSQHSCITLSLNHGRHVDFLDLSISATASHLDFCVYAKPTDTHFVLPKDSHPPPHTFKGILFGEFLRFATHSSTRTSFQHTVEEVTPVWKSLGYSRSQIRAAKLRVLSRTSQLSFWETGMFRCGDVSCSLCPYLDISNTFSHPTANVSYPINSRITCDSINVVYLIRCSKCSLLYVGQTQRSLKTRITQHLRSIRAGHSTTPLHTHFRSSCPINALKVRGIDIQPRESRRLEKEALWIRTLNTRVPLGLNAAAPKISSTTCNLVLPFSLCSTRLTAAIKLWCKDHVTVRPCYRRTSNLSEQLSRREAHS